jgi:hypothetical protein
MMTRLQAPRASRLLVRLGCNQILPTTICLLSQKPFPRSHNNSYHCAYLCIIRLSRDIRPWRQFLLDHNLTISNIGARLQEGSEVWVHVLPIASLPRLKWLLHVSAV